MLLVQNSLRYVNIMTFESILGVFCSRQVCFKELKIKLILPNLKHGAQECHSEACSLKKCTLPYTYFVFKCLVLNFGIKKEWLEKSLNTFSFSANILKWRKLAGSMQMDRKFMFMEKNLTPGGCLPLPWGYIHVYDHNIQTSTSLKPLY